MKLPISIRYVHGNEKHLRFIDMHKQDEREKLNKLIVWAIHHDVTLILCASHMYAELPEGSFESIVTPIN